MEREQLIKKIEKIEATIFSGKDVDIKEFYTLKKELIENKPFQKDLLELFLVLEAMLDKQHNDLLNKRLNLLTIWSTIFLPLSFYTGIFGMNFDDVPFLNNHHGFWIFTVLTIGTAIGMYFYFKKNKWI
jgi:magnesium transporter